MSFLNRGKNPKQHPEVEVEFSLALVPCLAWLNLLVLDFPQTATGNCTHPDRCPRDSAELNRTHFIPVFADLGVDFDRDLQRKRRFHKVTDGFEHLGVAVFQFKDEFVMDVEEHFCF